MTSLILFLVIATPFIILIFFMLADIAGILDANSNKQFHYVLSFVNTLIFPIVIFIGSPLLIWSIFKYFTVKNNNEMKIRSRNLIFYITLIFFLVIIFWLLINLIAETPMQQELTVLPGPLPTIP